MKPINFLLIILAATIIMLWQLFDPFLKSIAVALLLTIATNTIKTSIEFKINNRFLSSTIMTILLGLLFFIPVLYFIFEFVKYLHSIDQEKVVILFNETKILVSSISNDYLFLKQQLQQILNSIDIASVLANIVSFGANVGKHSASFMVDMIMILIFFFFFSFYGKELSFYIKDILPLKKEDSNELFSETANVMGVVFYSILATALFEGILFGTFISYYRYDGLLFGILYGFASLIPVIGGLIMWLPIVLVEVFNDNISNAVYIAVYSIVVISIIADAIIKPMIIQFINKKVVKTPTAINELLIFFSIIAGLSTFGFWGMIIGPATVTFFISIMSIIKNNNSLQG